MTVCTRCRNRNLETAKVCRFCGAPLPQKETSPPTGDQQPQPTGQRTEEPKQPVKGDTQPFKPPVTVDPGEIKPPAVIDELKPSGPPKDDADLTSTHLQLPDEPASKTLQAQEREIPVVKDTPEITRPQAPPETQEPPDDRGGVSPSPPVFTGPAPPPPPPPLPPPSRSPWWLAAVLAVIAAGGAGYLGGARTARNSQANLQDLAAKVQSQHRLVDQANRTASEQAAEITRLNNQIEATKVGISGKDGAIQDIQNRAAQTKNDLSAKLKTQDATIKRLEQQLKDSQAAYARDIATRQTLLTQLNHSYEAAQEKVQQLKSQLSTVQIAKPRDSSQTAVPQPKSGIITWSGNVRRNKTIEIRNGRPRTEGSFMGALPGIPVTIRPENPSLVSIVVSPGPENQWNRLAFKVQGSGPTTVKLFWTAQ